ncbi:MAG: hypothetical protein D6824_09500 [Planctomycetota bacterium]|nr:MAG: hypothetical protein D6824_09500 [Planctomycetota bacterium]
MTRTGRQAGRLLLAACLSACAHSVLVGCAATPGAATADTVAPAQQHPASAAPSYDEIARRWNERASELNRIWARAVVQLRYRDAEGAVHNEQGEGHLQLLQPARLALSVGKLGEILLWLGCDETRYWLIETNDTRRASVGRHATVGMPCHRSLGLPAHPLDMLDLMGVTPLPTQQEILDTGRPPGWVTWTRNHTLLVVEAPARFGRRRMFLDPATLLPRRVQLFPFERPSPHDQPAITADLSDPIPVTLRTRGGFYPKMASRVEINHPESGARIVLHFSDATDGRDRSGKLSPRVFDFESLVQALAVEQIDTLDADCQLATPAGEDASP